MSEVVVEHEGRVEGKTKLGRGPMYCSYMMLGIIFVRLTVLSWQGSPGAR